MFGSQTALAEGIRKFEIKSPLALTLSLDQRGVLYEQMGFDVPSYENGGADPEDPTSSRWGLVLHKLNIEYFLAAMTRPLRSCSQLATERLPLWQLPSPECLPDAMSEP